MHNWMGSAIGSTEATPLGAKQASGGYIAGRFKTSLH